MKRIGSKYDKMRKRAMAHYYLYREEILANRRADYAKNPEKYHAAAKQDYRKHLVARKASAMAYRESHREERHKKDHIYYVANKQKILNYQRKYRYGLTPEAFDKMLEMQGNACAICQTKDWNAKQVHIDHDHKSGKVRGILCNHCNSAIGLVGEDITVLKNMIKYLGAQYD